MDTVQTIRNSEDIYSSLSLPSLVTVLLSSASLPTGFKVCSASMRGSYGRLRRSPSPLRRGTHRIARLDELDRILVGDLSRAARHPVLEPRPLGQHRVRPEIRAISSNGDSELFDISFCHPLTPARIRDSVQNPLSILKAV